MSCASVLVGPRPVANPAHECESEAGFAGVGRRAGRRSLATSRTSTNRIARHVRVVTIIDLLPITIIDGSRGLHTAEVPVASSLDSGLSFRSLLSLGGGTGNAAWISLRPSLITEHHLVSTLNDLAPNLAPRSAQLGLGMANGQPRELGCECWFRCAHSACKDALASRKHPSDR